MQSSPKRNRLKAESQAYYQRVMSREQDQRHPDFDESQSLNIQFPSQLLPFFLKQNAKRAVEQTDNSHPKQDINEGAHNLCGLAYIQGQPEVTPF